jgi:hypothetical protein
MPKRDLTVNTKLTDTYTEKSVKLDKERQKDDIKKLLSEKKKIESRLDELKKLGLKKKSKKYESSDSESSSSSESEDEKPKRKKTTKKKGQGIMDYLNQF